MRLLSVWETACAWATCVQVCCRWKVTDNPRVPALPPRPPFLPAPTSERRCGLGGHYPGTAPPGGHAGLWRACASCPCVAEGGRCTRLCTLASAPAAGRRLRHPVPLSRERRPPLQPARLPHPAAVRRAPRATAGKLAFGPFSVAETRSPRSVSDGCSWQGRRKATSLRRARPWPGGLDAPVLHVPRAAAAQGGSHSLGAAPCRGD